MASSESCWRDAFDAVKHDSDFGALNELLELLHVAALGADGDSAGPAPAVNDLFDWEGCLLTPLFVAVLLRLDDHLPQLLALGANSSARCRYEGFSCCPLHAAALRGDVSTLRALLDAGCDVQALARTYGSGMKRSGGGGAQLDRYSSCNVLHVLLLRDTFVEEVYLLLLQRGVKLSAACRAAPSCDPLPSDSDSDSEGAEEVTGLELPRRLGNGLATEEKLDKVLKEELKYTIKTKLGSAEDLNSFLEVGSSLKRRHGATGYRFVTDVDFQLVDSGVSRADEAAPSALFLAAEVGNASAVRLLLYAGADPTKAATRSLPFGESEYRMDVQVSTIQMAVLRGDLQMIEQLVFFGVHPSTGCTGKLRHIGTGNVVEEWAELGLIHFAVLNGSPVVIPTLLRCECDVNAKAHRFSPPPALTGTAHGADSALFAAKAPGEVEVEGVTPLQLAILTSDVLCTAMLLDSGAHVCHETKGAGVRNRAVCEMFGGESPVGIEDWLSALLSGEPALQKLVDRRTDLSQALDWPDGCSVPELLDRHRLAGPDLVGRLEKALGDVPTSLRSVRPVHLACMLQQQWAVGMLADAGASVIEAAACHEVPVTEVVLPDSWASRGVPMDVVSLCARVGGLQMLEFLVQDARFAMDVRREIPLCLDLTPPFYPRRHSEDNHDLKPVWAWYRLAPLEIAVLHRRVDTAVLLVRLGADLLHTVDHVALQAPDHYSITDFCYRGLTPLHICALLNLTAAAAALLNEACPDKAPVVAGEHARAQRQALLTAVCSQQWATVDTNGDPDREPWLWKDMTPLHLAMVSKSYDVAEILVDASTHTTLENLCFSRDVHGDVERSFSPLLLAFEHNHKALHRRIAKKFPSC